MNIKKGDKVRIIAGNDKGATGVILAISHKKGKVKVQGVSLATRHYKARRQGETSGIRTQERFIDISNVAKL